MRRILFLILTVVPMGAWSQSASEEAIILNQELQFLQDSVDNVVSATTPNPVEPSLGENAGQESLERTYFSDDEKDEIRTRTAAPRRRSF